MAFIGALIVLCGLAVLSLIISQLHKVIALFEKRETEAEAEPETGRAGDNGQIRQMIENCNLLDMADATSVYQLLIEKLEQPFPLQSLYELAQQNGVPHVHLTIKSLRETGRLIPKGDGLFAWRPEGAPATDGPSPQPAAAPVPQPPPASPPAAAAPVPSPATAATAPAAPSAGSAPAATTESTAGDTPEPAASVPGNAITAPMPGMIVRYEKEVGDAVSEGETVVVLEAMKMENALAAPANGTIKAIHFTSGDSVAKGDVLCVIG